jgi:acyl-CoA reductase-like NAD-dependent aldehyde dehydrogenase
VAARCAQAMRKTGLVIAERFQTRTVWINEIHNQPREWPFARYRQSGFGIENGVNGLLKLTVPQTFSIRKTTMSAG